MVVVTVIVLEKGVNVGVISQAQKDLNYPKRTIKVNYQSGQKVNVFVRFVITFRIAKMNPVASVKCEQKVQISLLLVMKGDPSQGIK